VSERRSLLESLHIQIITIQSDWQNARAQRDAGKDTTSSSSANNGRNEALQLRLSLVSSYVVKWLSKTSLHKPKLSDSPISLMPINECFTTE